MKNKIPAILFLGYLLLANAAQSQVQFSTISFKEAQQEAKASNKMMLLVIESATCTQCNQVAMQGLTNPNIGSSINTSCVVLSINASHKDFAFIDSAYSIANTFGILFIDADGNYLHRYLSSTSLSATYLQQLNIALQKKDNPDLVFKQLLIDYQNGKRNFDLLYQLVAKKNAAKQEHDQLTEEMLNLAPADSANSLSFIQFLAEQAPVFDSKVYNYMHQNNQNFNDAWYLMNLQKRVAINGAINAKSKKKAITEKNVAYAERVANFNANTFSDRIRARKSHDASMLDYYKGIKDTASFLIRSVKFYDQYLMSISVDSVRKVDSIRTNEMFQNARSQSTAMPGQRIMSTSIQYAPITQNYTRDLNNGAWTLYTYTHDAYYTEKALTWIKRANEFYEDPGAMDTYARLLYRKGEKAEAILLEEKAITLGKSRRMPMTEFEVILSNMKAGKPSIDMY